MGSNLADKLNPEKLKTGGEYRIIDPRLTYRGKSYSEWISDWFNWFISADADIRNSGPVVFLRSMGLPKEGDMLDSTTRRTPVDNSTTPNLDPNYPKKYFSGANIRIGGDRLQITEDQAVLVPIIMAYEFGGSPYPYKDWGYLQDFTGLTIDHGDDPPNKHQLTIENEDIKFRDGIGMDDFRIVTPIFTAIIPEVEYGRSVKDFLEIPAISGSYPVMVEGYFVMLKFKSHTNSYWIHSWASAPREATGPYFSELIYEIQVFEKRKPHGVITKERPARNEALLIRILEEEQKKPKVGRDVVSTASRIESYLKRGVTGIKDRDNTT
jgi:hypothetical protein